MTSLNDKQHQFWLDNIHVLYNDYLDFIPRHNTSREEQLNSVTRLCIYFLLLSIILKLDEKCIYLPVIIIILTILLHLINTVDKDKRKKEIDRIIKTRIENNNEIDEDEENNFIDSDNDVSSYKPKQFKKDVQITGYKDSDVSSYRPKQFKKDVQIEAGYKDSNNNNISNEFYDKGCFDCKNFNDIYTYDELKEYEKETCKKPTNDNPLMNPSVTDFNNGNIPVACNVDDEDIKNDINEKVDYRLYRNIEDVWNIENSQRQFYSVPSKTVPNNQKDFANWLYKIPETCKEVVDSCVYYEDLRYKR